MPNLKPIVVGFLLCLIAGAIGWFARQSAIAPPETPAATFIAAPVPAPASQSVETSRAKLPAPTRAGGPWSTATAAFNVLDSNSISPLLGPKPHAREELSHFMITQTKLIKLKDFYDLLFDVAKIQATKWYKSFESRDDLIKELDDALDAQAVPDTTLIRLRLSIAQRDEAEAILNVIAEQYILWIDSMAAKQREADLKAFREVVNGSEKKLMRAEIDAGDYRSLHDVNSLAKSLDIAHELLLDMARELNKLTVDRNLLQNSVDGVAAAQADPNYKIPAEYFEQLERDPAFRSLDDLRMSLERTREVALQEKNADAPEVKKITAELEVTKKQLKERNEILTARAKEQQLSSVAGALAVTNARILDVKKKHDLQQAEIRKLDNDLVAYRGREEAVKACRAEFNHAQSEYNRQEAIARSSQLRVQFVGRAKPVNRDGSDRIANP